MIGWCRFATVSVSYNRVKIPLSCRTSSSIATLFPTTPKKHFARLRRTCAAAALRRRVAPRKLARNRCFKFPSRTETCTEVIAPTCQVCGGALGGVVFGWLWAPPSGSRTSAGGGSFAKTSGVHVLRNRSGTVDKIGTTPHTRTNTSCT